MSLQGESTHAGRLCFFVRLAGCNLDCSYCDTPAAKPFDAGCVRSVAEIVAEAVASGANFVEVTGGEPLAQADSIELLEALLAAGLEVALETNGSLPLDRVPPGVIRIVDYKLPSSGMAQRMLPENFRRLNGRDEVKFVIGSREDYQAAREVLERFDIAKQTANILYSPVWGAVDFAELASWIIADRLPGRMQIQLHKIIWGPDTSGV
ncbi:MAG: 7-carboxy-7-deazaguanine synthase QueE [Victivallaceae bacterium]